MRGLPRLLTATAVIVAIPFGWMLGVVAAELIVRPEFGVFPVLTIPFGLAVAIWFALSHIATPAVRLAIMVLGTAAIAALA